MLQEHPSGASCSLSQSGKVPHYVWSLRWAWLAFLCSEEVESGEGTEKDPSAALPDTILETATNINQIMTNKEEMLKATDVSEQPYVNLRYSSSIWRRLLYRSISWFS